MHIYIYINLHNDYIYNDYIYDYIYLDILDIYQNFRVYRHG